MPVEAKPLFRPDVIRSHLAAFSLPDRIEPLRRQLADWASLSDTGRANNFKEQELLPDFLTLYFHGVLGLEPYHRVGRSQRGAIWSGSSAVVSQCSRRSFIA